ncbi:MAG: NAD(P)H-binding protein [Chloroflexota bacterium]
MDDRIILVTGATGYIASRLIPRLLERGCRVRCLARTPSRLGGRGWSSRVEIVPGSLVQPDSLDQAMRGVSAAYYLVHSMAAGRGYSRLDLEAARHFAEAAASAGVEHIIYLGGLADPRAAIAPHLRSRIETGDELRRGPVPVTEFRAGVIVGPGSISFEMIRFLTELMPVLVGPPWLENLSQPIAAEDVVGYLLAALDTPACRGGTYEIGGAEKMPYVEAMLRYARHRGLRRRFVPLPGIPVRLMALIAEMVTPVPASIAYPLIESLGSPSHVREASALDVFPHIQPLDCESSLARSLAQLSPEFVEPVWLDDAREAVHLRHEGFFIDYRSRDVPADAGEVFEAVMSLAGTLKGYRVETAHPDGLLRLVSTRRLPGRCWIEWRVRPLNGSTRLSQTAFFAPKGLPGFLCAWLWGPVNRIVFRRLIRAIKNFGQSPSFET